MNKRGQVEIVAFIGVIVTLLFLAPIMLKIVNTSVGGFSDAINSTSPEAATEVDYVHDTFVSFWDILIAIGFLVNVLLLFIFAFLVDTHPIFSLLYLIGAMITLMFSHIFVTPIETILGMNAFSEEVLQIPITNFIVNWFDLIVLGIIIVTGIITYGKFKGGGFER